MNVTQRAVLVMDIILQRGILGWLCSNVTCSMLQRHVGGGCGGGGWGRAGLVRLARHGGQATGGRGLRGLKGARA